MYDTCHSLVRKSSPIIAGAERIQWGMVSRGDRHAVSQLLSQSNI